MKSLFLFAVGIILALTCCSPSDIPEPDDTINFLSDIWLAQKADLVGYGGEIISRPEFNPVGWLDAVVPGTVLSTLLFNKLVPDPFFSMNNELIPDINEMGVEYYTYWFYTKFKLPHEV